MRTKCLMGFFVVLMPVLIWAQVPIDALWTQLVPSSSLDSRLAYDNWTERLYLAFQPGPSDSHTYIHAYNVDGSVVEPQGMLMSIGSFLSPTIVTGFPSYRDEPLRLLAQQDTLYLIHHYLDWLDPWRLYRSTRITVDSSNTFTLYNGINPLVDVHHDHVGDIDVSATLIRSYSKSHWPLGRAVVPTTDRIAADALRIYCGRLPNIVAVNRQSMSLLTPLVVPSSGTSVRTLLMLQGNVVHYASLNNDNTLDIGAVDTTGALIWNSIVSNTASITLSGLTLDAFGNMWVAASRGGSSPTGLLYRFGPLGSMTGSYTYGRTVRDIVSSGDKIFITGGDAAQTTMVYLAAFDTDITTSAPETSSVLPRIAPNPGSDNILVDGLLPQTKQLIITDMAGRFVQEIFGPFGGTLSIPVAHLPNGTYMFRCESEGLVTLRRFSVMH